ncbi:hypothetical protein FOXG_18883 [Fusarium oxysporum f. sp. lycopersici 4287]|uniref:Uncharacterized protein n=2 Tax=Fusarium oxysporum TaxID=5507 RepID=A0A0J9WK56_FUSO4|nr:hypothetical protein FOXG_18883 [Fusarium oxysporum f. sp. lycopersici 4287]EXK43439.1 hypothetical protein FOMG_02396 [Fusarium oxysporum f. sp. melonis 26406]KNB01447.1 hypothetical protein FOXG_18883 [Fusarium oxysporum f. sp. lycopersici 4287]
MANRRDESLYRARLDNTLKRGLFASGGFGF